MAGTPITASCVAQAAHVSTWLLYTEGVREHLDAARRRQAQTAPTLPATPTTPDPRISAGLRTDLALAREEIRRLRGEHDKLRKRLQLQLGAEIDGPERADLISRVSELETLNRQLIAERDARLAETTHAQRRVHELEDDLTATRESLRKVIKDHNRTTPQAGT